MAWPRPQGHLEGGRLLTVQRARSFPSPPPPQSYSTIYNLQVQCKLESRESKLQVCQFDFQANYSVPLDSG